ncbi:hypothetical protein SmJEL517_g03257 [Synchytrium microbalum]|uniref:Uncharacterized protein n=1 Tax=Synchytrium microbalum TaxID=1806994 RepID=A0A507BXM3_9FUNG|nr:uncharacterized protein SmJEL517_g03257 [Synchytrium microbalum]TPX34070.1 hypothetical protein SmJEL517_g03257 [Synchytrium microbalum]
MSGSKLLAPFKVLVLPLGRNNIFFHCHVADHSPLHSSMDKPNKFITAAHKTTAKLHKMWHSWGEAPEKSIKKRTFDLGTNLLDRIPVEESFCMSIPSLKGHHASSLGEVEVAFVGSLQQTEVEQKLHALVKSRDAFHRRWFALSCLCLPFSLSLSIVPGPNLPMAYNLYRVYCHYTAKNGVATLGEFLNINSISYKPVDASITYDADTGLISHETILQLSRLSEDADGVETALIRTKHQIIKTLPQTNASV